MPEELRVYLDHLIQRESLRYERPNVAGTSDPPSNENLRLSDFNNSRRMSLIRKPDFQRETWAWTPEDCVSLLESVVNGQVIPSIIMWSSPSGYDYILDGGHRVSVVLAWILNDWGDNLPSSRFRDTEHESLVKRAAAEVRELVRVRVGLIDDYIAAERRIEEVMKQGGAPQVDMHPAQFKKGYFYQSLLKGRAQLHVLWNDGDYEKAEQSFLKINKSGRQLSDWEIKLVTNRNSSFARVTMSVASIQSAQNYWPKQLDMIRTGENTESPTPDELASRVSTILEGIKEIYTMLFSPQYTNVIQSLRQPLFVAAGAHQRPFYLAEFLTVIEGGRGNSAETEALLSRGRDANPVQIVLSGYELVRSTLEIVNHLIGPSSEPASLALVPAVYFYNENGKHVRSLLYGFTYWMFNGTEREILQRKRLFSAYRGEFENILIERKDDIVGGLSRQTGSGPEVTVQTAHYLDSLLKLLNEYNGNIELEEFGDRYEAMLATILQKRSRSTPKAIKARTFSSTQKSALVLRALLTSPVTCGICGGVLDPAMGVQTDHVIPYSLGGKTEIDNGRLTHPFCNNQRERILQIRKDHTRIELPTIIADNFQPGSPQLSFLDDLDFSG